MMRKLVSISLILSSDSGMACSFILVWIRSKPTHDHLHQLQCKSRANQDTQGGAESRLIMPILRVGHGFVSRGRWEFVIQGRCACGRNLVESSVLSGAETDAEGISDEGGDVRSFPGGSCGGTGVGTWSRHDGRLLSEEINRPSLSSEDGFRGRDVGEEVLRSSEHQRTDPASTSAMKYQVGDLCEEQVYNALLYCCQFTL